MDTVLSFAALVIPIWWFVSRIRKVRSGAARPLLPFPIWVTGNFFVMIGMVIVLSLAGDFVAKSVHFGPTAHPSALTTESATRNIAALANSCSYPFAGVCVFLDAKNAKPYADAGLVVVSESAIQGKDANTGQTVDQGTKKTVAPAPAVRDLAFDGTIVGDDLAIAGAYCGGANGYRYAAFQCGAITNTAATKPALYKASGPWRPGSDVALLLVRTTPTVTNIVPAKTDPEVRIVTWTGAFAPTAAYAPAVAIPNQGGLWNDDFNFPRAEFAKSVVAAGSHSFTSEFRWNTTSGTWDFVAPFYAGFPLADARMTTGEKVQMGVMAILLIPVLILFGLFMLFRSAMPWNRGGGGDYSGAPAPSVQLFGPRE